MAYTDLGVHLFQQGKKVGLLTIPDDKPVAVYYSCRNSIIDVSFLTNWQGESCRATLIIPFTGTRDWACRYIDKIRGVILPVFLSPLPPKDLQELKAGTSVLNLIPFFVCPILLPIPTPYPQEIKAQEKRQRRAQKRMAIANHG